MLTSASLYFREPGPTRALPRSYSWLSLFCILASQPFGLSSLESQSLTSSRDGQGIPQVACGSVKPQWLLLPDCLTLNEIPGVYHFISLLLIIKYQPRHEVCDKRLKCTEGCSTSDHILESVNEAY